ncbi:MAG: response regulator [Desulfobulbaceae bacterium]|nr:MAG: response regulator [Desulfobulbaceae bacterium]
MKILIVDDEIEIREILRLWCEEEGFTVYDAENGREAVVIQRQTPVDFMICDLIMPVQEGIETITYFNQEFPNVTIIAISGGGKIGPDSYLEVASQLGAWKTFRKPLNRQELIDTIIAKKQHT